MFCIYVIFVCFELYSVQDSAFVMAPSQILLYITIRAHDVERTTVLILMSELKYLGVKFKTV